jgi:hypothetical protein
LIGAVGIEPTTFGLKVGLSIFPLFRISELRSRCLVEFQLFGLFQGNFRTFSVPSEPESNKPRLNVLSEPLEIRAALCV